MMDTYLRSSLSRMQASLFEMSGNLGYDSERFIKTFKKSKVARDVDSEFNFIIGQEKNTYWSE